MLLLFLLALLTGPYFILALAGRRLPLPGAAPEKRARLGLTLFFAFTALGHFTRAEEMAAMLPASVPYRTGVVYLTGVLEVLGAAGVWVPGLTRLTGLCLILMLLAFLPANVYAAVNRVDFGGHGAGPAYLLARVPFQFFVIWWIYYSTLRKPAGGRRREAARASGRVPAGPR